MQKSRKKEITFETYLDVVDDLRNDEERHFLDQMNIFGVDPDGVELQLITLVPSSTC